MFSRNYLNLSKTSGTETGTTPGKHNPKSTSDVQQNPNLR